MLNKKNNKNKIFKDVEARLKKIKIAEEKKARKKSGKKIAEEKKIRKKLLIIEIISGWLLFCSTFFEYIVYKWMHVDIKLRLHIMYLVAFFEIIEEESGVCHIENHAFHLRRQIL